MPGKRFLARLLTGLALGVSGIQAQTLPFDLDLGLFRTAGDRTRLEVYLGVNRSQIHYEPIRDGYAAHLAGVVLLKQHGQIIDFRKISIADVVDRLDDGPWGTIPGQVTFSLSPGQYDVKVVVEDRRGNQYDSTLYVEVSSYRELALSRSTIQLAHLIRRTARQKEFFKQGVTVWPNAGAVYDDAHPLLWYYVEIYGLTPLDTVDLRTVVWRDSAEVISLDPRRVPSPTLVYCDWGAVSLSAQAEGDYHLTLTAVVDGDTTTAVKPFRVAREAPAPSDTGDVLAALSSAQLTDFARGLSMIQPGLDMQQFRSGDIAIRNRMIRDAAGRAARELSRDSTTYLSDLIRHWSLIQSFEQGWRARGRLSDQARTLFLHGPPAAIETYPATTELREHHIWTFTGPDSTAQCVFMDREGYGELILVHATVPGGVRSEDWSRELSWVPVPIDTAAAPAAAVEEETPPPAALDTARIEPAIADSLTAPEPEAVADTLAVDTAAVELVPPDTTAVDTLLLEPAGVDTSAVDTAAVELVPPDTTTVDTTATDTLLLEPAGVDTSRTP